MKKIIKYFSAKDFKNFMKSYGYTSFMGNRMMPYNHDIHEDFAIISIGNYAEWNDVDNDTELYANGVNNHWIPSGVNVLNIEFGDVDETDLSAMSEGQAYDIINFIDANINKQQFFIHCSAGVSRSGGVASFLYDYFKELGYEVTITPKYPETPNYYVKMMLNKTKREKNIE